MKQFAVIGYPISHSLSPHLHNEIFKQLNLNASYKTFKILPKNLGEFSLKNKCDGYNVTIPHKIAITKYLNSLDESAKHISAVNCVHNNIGYNTDWIGFMNAMEFNNVKLEGKNCLIIGAGGVAYAIAYALIKSKVKSISVQNRTKENTENLLKWINKRISNNIVNNPDVIINCTPLGMSPNINITPNHKKLNKKHIAIDTIYNPIETKWLNNCKSDGAQTIGGLDMFIGQGIASINIWLQTDIKNDIDTKLIKNKLEKILC